MNMAEKWSSDIKLPHPSNVSSSRPIMTLLFARGSHIESTQRGVEKVGLKDLRLMPRAFLFDYPVDGVGGLSIC